MISPTTLRGRLSMETFGGQRFDDNGESTMGMVITGSLIHINPSASTATIEDDIEFGCTLGPIRRDENC